MKSLAAAGRRYLSAAYSAMRRIGQALYRSDVRYAEEDHRAEFMRRAFHALGFNGISGDYAEFGSHGGTTVRLAYGEIRRWRTPRKLWAFDSFEGLPEQRVPKDYHPGWKKGKMATSVEDFIATCRQTGIPDDRIKVVAGFYEDTLAGKPLDDPRLPSDIALAFVDCDLYSSTISVLEFLLPRLKNGMILAFDDYFAFSDRTLSGNRQAMLDVFGDDVAFRLLPYVQFGWHGMSFIVEDRNL